MIPYLNQVFNEDVMLGINKIPDDSVDLILTDPPYSLGKDYGNNSDKQSPEQYLLWTYSWIDAVLPKLKPNGSFYIFLSWQYSPEIFCYLKQKLTMINEIIWDRRVPSMGGSTRKYSSVHDNLGFFVKGKDYYFDLDSIRIPYDEETKKARTRSIFVGKKWLELGYNPKDIWTTARLHAEDPERTTHPTQKPLEIIERIILASSKVGDLVFDPFMGSGTTAFAAKKLQRNYTGFEINPEYHEIISDRLEGKLNEVRRVKNKSYAEEKAALTKTLFD
jgi:site-specific DNA-methyltransferase (adenine-specific)